jgi:hypothetical protein
MAWPTREDALAEARRRLGEEWYLRAVETMASFEPAAPRQDGLPRVSVRANRPDFVRILYQVMYHLETIPGPTAWAYFDVGMGWADAASFASDFTALVRVWASELQSARKARSRRR